MNQAPASTNWFVSDIRRLVDVVVMTNVFSFSWKNIYISLTPSPSLHRSSICLWVLLAFLPSLSVRDILPRRHLFLFPSLYPSVLVLSSSPCHPSIHCGCVILHPASSVFIVITRFVNSFKTPLSGVTHSGQGQRRFACSQVSHTHQQL